MPEGTAPSASPRRSAYRETARKRAESVPCSSLFQLINTVEALRTRQEHAERLIRLSERRPFSANLPLPPAAVNNREASPSTPQAALDAIASAATFPAPQESPDLTDGCSQPCGPASVPLPQKSDTEVEIMDTSSSRKRPRPTENTSDDEGSSRKVPAVTPAPESGTPPPVEASAVLHDADDDFQTVQSKSQKRRQRAAAAAGTAARCVPPSGSTHSGSSAAAAAPPAVVTTTPTSVSTRASPQQCGITVLFRPAIPGATFPRTSRLSFAQALSALPGVQEVRVNTKKNVVAADAITPDWRDRLLATTELAGIPVNARMPADRTQSSGIVQGILGNYTEEELLAGVQSDVPVLAAKRQRTALILRFAASTPPAQVRLFRMVHAVRACRPRPLQCLRCGSYGHTTATCNRTQRCLRCGGGPHGDSTCTSKAKCLHCGRAHTADSPDCQLWQRERRLATIKASAPSFLTHREAMAALQQPAAASPPAPTSQETGISYAQAAKKPRGARKPPGHPGYQRACPKHHHGQELADMCLLLRANLCVFEGFHIAETFRMYQHNYVRGWVGHENGGVVLVQLHCHKRHQQAFPSANADRWQMKCKAVGEGGAVD
ncbi:hypothetical protein HPB50_029343 [Hyalomma asiaticum]|nr:hypothetical protein HPB50_029343 [Hyalomma asiaticum]